MSTKQPAGYSFIFRTFLKIGAQAFSGWPMAALLTERELVEKHQRLTKSQLQGAFAYAYLIPGASQVAFISNIGYRLRGFPGATLATASYLAPALILMVLFAALYFRYLQHTTLTSHMAGLSAALGGVILASAYRIGRAHAVRPQLWVLVAGAFALRWAGVNTAAVIILFGLGGMGWSFARARLSRRPL
jgi:chromate transporter